MPEGNQRDPIEPKKPIISDGYEEWEDKTYGVLPEDHPDFHKDPGNIDTPPIDGEDDPSATQPYEKLPPVLDRQEDLSSELLSDIKNDILEQARKDAVMGSEYSLFNGFYDSNHHRYARVIQGDFADDSIPDEEVEVKYDENLTPEQTDNIRESIYSELGALPPTDDKFDEQKRASNVVTSDKVAKVVTPTNRLGVNIVELRVWRALPSDIAEKYGRDVLDFVEWGIAIEKAPVASDVRVNEVVPHISGINSSEVDVDFIDPDSDEIEVDMPTALSMAKSGHEHRSIAAKKRGNLRLLEEYADAVKQVRGRRFGRERRLYELSYHDPRFETDDTELKRAKWSVEGAVGNRDSGAQERLAEMVSAMREEARKADDRAEKQEEWARVLHAHPPSEAFKQSYQDVKFGPHSLAHLEDWLPYRKDLAEQILARADNNEEIDLVVMLNSTSHWLDSMEDNQAPQDVIDELDRRFLSLNESKSSTTAAYEQLYKDVKRAYAQHELAKVKQQTDMLEELRSGRASNQAYIKSWKSSAEAYEASTKAREAGDNVTADNLRHEARLLERQEFAERASETPPGAQ